jgi:hypothetical protein
MQNHPQKVSDCSHHPKNLSTESTICGSGARSLENSTANRTMYEAGSLSSSGVTMSNDTEPEKVWHYKDPSGNVQGPFTLLQLSKWTSYFPRDLRVWLTFESEERSLLLTEVLSKQQKDFTQAASHTSSKATLVGTGHTRNNPSVDQTNAFSPAGHSVVSFSGITVQYNKLGSRLQTTRSRAASSFRAISSHRAGSARRGCGRRRRRRNPCVVEISMVVGSTCAAPATAAAAGTPWAGPCAGPPPPPPRSSSPQPRHESPCSTDCWHGRSCCSVVSNTVSAMSVDGSKSEQQAYMVTEI